MAEKPRKREQKQGKLTFKAQEQMGMPENTDEPGSGQKEQLAKPVDKQ